MLVSSAGEMPLSLAYHPCPCCSNPWSAWHGRVLTVHCIYICDWLRYNIWMSKELGLTCHGRDVTAKCRQVLEGRCAPYTWNLLKDRPDFLCSVILIVVVCGIRLSSVALISIPSSDWWYILRVNIYAFHHILSALGSSFTKNNVGVSNVPFIFSAIMSRWKVSAYLMRR